MTVDERDRKILACAWLSRHDSSALARAAAEAGVTEQEFVRVAIEEKIAAVLGRQSQMKGEPR